jgi:hypothetical protein
VKKSTDPSIEDIIAYIENEMRKLGCDSLDKGTAT